MTYALPKLYVEDKSSQPNDDKDLIPTSDVLDDREKLFLMGRRAHVGLVGALRLR